MRDGRFLIVASTGLEDGLPDAKKAEAQIHTEQLVQCRRRLPITVDTAESCGLISEFLA